MPGMNGIPPPELPARPAGFADRPVEPGKADGVKPGSSLSRPRSPAAGIEPPVDVLPGKAVGEKPLVSPRPPRPAPSPRPRSSARPEVPPMPVSPGKSAAPAPSFQVLGSSARSDSGSRPLPSRPVPPRKALGVTSGRPPRPESAPRPLPSPPRPVSPAKGAGFAVRARDCGPRPSRPPRPESSPRPPGPSTPVPPLNASGLSIRSSAAGDMVLLNGVRPPSGPSPPRPLTSPSPPRPEPGPLVSRLPEYGSAAAYLAGSNPSVPVSASSGIREARVPPL